MALEDGLVRKPVLDSVVITVSLIIDNWFGGHEALDLSFLCQYHPTLFPNGQFNHRRTCLGPIIELTKYVA